eukprot:10392173-Alexandrium_andersonii.AAC.1
MTAEALVLNHCLRNSTSLSGLPSVAVGSLLFRMRAVRPQASSARLGASRSGTPFRALCSVAIAMPPKRGD